MRLHKYSFSDILEDTSWQQSDYFSESYNVSALTAQPWVQEFYCRYQLGLYILFSCDSL